jgi:hypothetical protein
MVSVVRKARVGVGKLVAVGVVVEVLASCGLGVGVPKAAVAIREKLKP